MRKLICVLFIMGLATNKAFAVAAVVYDPSNYAKNVITAQNSITQLAKLTQQIQNQLNMLRYQALNTQALGSYQWRDITNFINTLDLATRQNQSLSYSMANISSQFSQSYPNYMNTNPTNLAHVNKTWNTTTLNSIQNTMSALNTSANNFQNEQAVLTTLKSQAQNATGQMQVLQANSAMSAENINQLQSLKRIVSAEANAQNAYMAREVSKESFEAESLKRINESLDTDSVNYKSNKQLGLIPNFPK